MARSNSSRVSAAAHVVSFRDEEQPSEARGLRSVEDVERERNSVVYLNVRQAPSARQPAAKRSSEPAVLARWAVFLAAVMVIAAATSGQA
ncbi:MAG: hypothetical protein WCI34_00690 [Actinomycetes bacterium]